MFLIFIFLTISIFIYLEYFKKAGLEIINEKKISQAINTGESLIEDLKNPNIIFNQDISNWDVSKGQNFRYMFANSCSISTED